MGIYILIILSVFTLQNFSIMGAKISKEPKFEKQLSLFVAGIIFVAAGILAIIFQSILL